MFAAPIYLVLIAAEIYVAGRKGSEAREAVRRDLWTNLAMGTGNVIASLTLYGGVGALMLFAWQNRVWDLGVSVGTLVLAMVAKDFVYYWVHRFQHRIRWCWANHVIHHSSTGYNLSTALRQPWFSVTTGTYLLGVPVIMLGVHPGLYAFAGGLNLFYQFFVHTQEVGKLPRWVENVFNTPSHHRVHHATNPRYLDTNYAGILIIWDRLFGTFAEEDAAEPCTFGIVSNLPSQNPFYVATHEYAAIARDITQPGLTALERFRYAFAPPGYSHDGSRLSTAEIKRRAGVSLSGGQTASMGHPPQVGAPVLERDF